MAQLATDSLRPGSPAWVAPVDLEWVKCVVKSINGTRVTVTFSDGTERAFSSAEVERANGGKEAVREFADITQLTHLNEPSILELLESRFLEDDIYTSAGPVLVAINPCRRLPDLFSEELRRNYQDAKLEAKLPPHMYKVVATAYRSMEMDAANQALVVSGESGAGKTESTKMALDYFATMSGGTGISAAILQSNPILEAFGNAKTTRNPNSSRFGKLLQVYFSLNADGYSRHLNSAEIQTYLLEKSRVVGPGAGERNYHVFYMLLRGASEGEREAWQLPPPEQAAATFQYIKGGVQDAAGRDDAADWAEMREAMDAIRLGGEVQQQLFSLLAGILWLGNVTFCSSDSDDSCSVDPSASGALAKAAALLGVEEGSLRTALTSKVLQTGRDVIVKPLRAGEARVARDSLAKGVYSALFDYLVEAINRQLNPDKKLLDSDKFIAVLDIFGFEHFEVNSFEQLCINYANERLQQLFCHHLFQHEQAEYQREGLQWALHRYSDNAHLVALLDASTQPLGVLKLLDDQCTQRGGGSDQNLLESIRKEHALGGGGRGAKTGGLAIPSRPPGTFAVQHFAGPVAYSVEGMVGKNMDDLSLGLKQLMAGSSGALLRQLGATLLEDSSRRRSVASTFGRQMNRLVDTLQRAQLHFVRCIKPNPALQPGRSDARMILDQIRCAGVVEVGRIFKEGYPTRTSISLFLKRFNRSLIGLDLPSPPPPPSPSPPSFSAPPTSGRPQSSHTSNTASALATATGQPSAATPAPAPSPAAAAPTAGGGTPADLRARADRVLQQRFGLEPDLHYALGLTKIFFRAGVLGSVEAEFQRLERLSLQVQGCASYWRDFARVQPVRRKFMELARGHKQWLAEQAQLRALEEERRKLEEQRAAASAASAAAAAAAAAERERQERERQDAEEEQRRTEAEEEKQREERQQVQRMWQELAAEREATQKAEADAEAERAARKKLETQADAEREARQKLEVAAAAAHEELQRRMEAMDEEKAEWEEAERKLKEREGAVAAQLEAIRLKEEEVQRREEEARALQEREEALRVKEQEVEALLKAEREKVAERMGGGGDLQVSQMVQLLGASRTRHDVEAGLQRGQAASAHHDSQDAAASEARTRIDSQVSTIVVAARFRSLLSKSSASSTIAEEVEGRDEGEADALPPLPPLLSAISLSDVPIFSLPSTPTTPGAASLPQSPSAAGPSPRQLRAAAEAAEAAEAEAAAAHKRRLDYKELVAVVEAIEGGAAASHPLAGEATQLIMDAIAGMATLDEDVAWVEGVKAGQVQASAVMQMRVVELQVGDKYQQLQQDIKVGACLAVLPIRQAERPTGCCTCRAGVRADWLFAGTFSSQSHQIAPTHQRV